MEMRFTPPILLLVCNRPDLTEQVFKTIRNVQPKRLYVAADGPQDAVGGDIKLCEHTREVATAVDWDCSLRTLFRDRNLGVRVAVSSAIDWFFEEEEEGIILEDDCVPSKSFYAYCAQLLARYRNTPQVMAVSGVNFQFGAHKVPYSYYFSRYNHCWGWAGWRRSWKAYDDKMSEWPKAREAGTLERVLSHPRAARYWTETFDKAYRNEVDSWAYRWTLSTWLAGGVAALPSVNLVSNIGFGEKATHTKGTSSLAFMKTEELAFPLTHPPSISVDEDADRRTFENCYRSSVWRRIKNKLTGILKQHGVCR